MSYKLKDDKILNKNIRISRMIFYWHYLILVEKIIDW